MCRRTRLSHVSWLVFVGLLFAAACSPLPSNEPTPTVEVLPTLPQVASPPIVSVAPTPTPVLNAAHLLSASESRLATEGIHLFEAPPGAAPALSEQQALARALTPNQSAREALLVQLQEGGAGRACRDIEQPAVPPFDPLLRMLPRLTRLSSPRDLWLPDLPS